MPRFTHAQHVAFTVTDREASAEWYQRILGFRLVRKLDTGIPRILLIEPESKFVLSLCNHPDGSGDHFSPLRTGLDHLAFAVEDEGTLAAWVTHFDDRGVDHSPIRDLGNAKFVSFEDPDGIQLELWLIVTPHMPADDRE
jgi:glyoxylase I family protein